MSWMVGWVMASVMSAGWASQTPKPLVDDVVFTGKNGYEDYITAAERLRDPSFMAWYSTWRGGAPEDSRNHLQRCNWAWDQYAKVADLIEVGNGKPVFDPHQRPYLERTFPELSQLRTLDALLRAGAYSEFAKGRSDRATDQLIRAFAMNRRLAGSGASLMLLWGYVQDLLLFAAIEERLDSFSVADLSRLSTTVEALIQNPPSVAQVAAYEGAAMAGSVTLFLNPEAYGTTLNDTENSSLGGIQKAIRELNEEERKRLIPAITESVRRRAMADQALFDRPEWEWPTGPKPDFVSSGNLEQDIAALIFDWNAIHREPSVLARMQTLRIQYRLLALHLRLARFHLEHQHYPSSLTELGGDVVDPFTKKPYLYTLEDGRYYLASNAFPDFGEITLRRPAFPSDDEPEVVPPSMISQVRK